MEVSVRGLEPLIFHSVGIGTPGSLTVGENQTWHLPEGAIARLGKGRLSQVDKAIAFSPGGQRLAVVSSLGIWLYDVTTLRPMALLPADLASRGSLAFSPDGTALAFSDRRTIRLWDLATAESHRQPWGGNRLLLRLFHRTEIPSLPGYGMVRSSCGTWRQENPWPPWRA